MARLNGILMRFCVSAFVVASLLSLDAAAAQARAPKLPASAPGTSLPPRSTQAATACATEGENCRANAPSSPPVTQLQDPAGFLGVCEGRGTALEARLKLLCSKVYGPLYA